MEGRDSVLLQILARVLGAEADIGVGGQVKDEVVPDNRTSQGGEVEEIPLDEAESGMAERIGEDLALAGREVVVGGNGMAVGQQSVDQVAADEASPAGDEILH